MRPSKRRGGIGLCPLVRDRSNQILTCLFATLLHGELSSRFRVGFAPFGQYRLEKILARTVIRKLFDPCQRGLRIRPGQLSGDCSGYVIFGFTGCQGHNVCRRGRGFVLRPSSKDALPRRVLTFNERFCPTERRSRVFLRPLFRDISNSLIADVARGQSDSDTRRSRRIST